MTLTFEEARRLRTRLGTVWDVMLAPFGRLTPIQADAMPVVLAGRDALLASPTASGKTEAALAPLARRFLDTGREDGPWLVYVVPTRALTADLGRRLKDLLAELGIPSAFRTSDTPSLPKSFPPFLFTTPESLDSLLCRKKDVWRHVGAIVLDEIHLLDNTYRGDQLRCLLARLEHGFLQGPVQRILMSASVPDAAAMAARYAPGAEVVGSGTPRDIEFAVVDTVGQALATCKERKRFKILLFCNSRKECELVADDIVRKRQWPADCVFVHHASLSATVRKETERSFAEARAAVCVATTTLELGVDIGDVSATVLFSAPPSPSAFLQRVGRSCRREHTIFALGVALTQQDREALVVMEQLVRRSLLERIEYRPDFSVAVQQIFSMLFARPTGVEPAVLLGNVEPICPADVFEDILAHLSLLGWVERQGRTVRASQRVMDLGEKGDLHANIPEERTVEVVDASTGKRLGSVSPWGAQQQTVLLAGQAWTVTGSEGRRLVANRASGLSSGGGFARHSEFGKYFSLLPQPIRDRMRDERLSGPAPAA